MLDDRIGSPALPPWWPLAGRAGTAVLPSFLLVFPLTFPKVPLLLQNVNVSSFWKRFLMQQERRMQVDIRGVIEAELNAGLA